MQTNKNFIVIRVVGVGGIQNKVIVTSDEHSYFIARDQGSLSHKVTLELRKE